MDHVAARIEQDVSIMSVLDLQNVAEKRVANHRSHEVFLGCLVSPEILRVLILHLQGLLHADALQSWYRRGTAAEFI